MITLFRSVSNETPKLSYLAFHPLLRVVTIVKRSAIAVAMLCELEMWANAQRDGRSAEYTWRPLFNAAKFG